MVKTSGTKARILRMLYGGRVKRPLVSRQITAKRQEGMALRWKRIEVK